MLISEKVEIIGKDEKYKTSIAPTDCHNKHLGVYCPQNEKNNTSLPLLLAFCLDKF